MKNKWLLAYLMGLGLSNAVVAQESDAMQKEAAPQDVGVMSAEPQESFEMSAEDEQLQELLNDPTFLKQLEDEVKKFEEGEKQKMSAQQAEAPVSEMAPTTMTEEVMVMEEPAAMATEEVAEPMGECPASATQQPEQTWWEWVKSWFGY